MQFIDHETEGQSHVITAKMTWLYTSIWCKLKIFVSYAPSKISFASNFFPWAIILYSPSSTLKWLPLSTQILIVTTQIKLWLLFSEGLDLNTFRIVTYILVLLCILTNIGGKKSALIILSPLSSKQSFFHREHQFLRKYPSLETDIDPCLVGFCAFSVQPSDGMKKGENILLN